MAVVTMDFRSTRLKMNTLVTLAVPDSGRIESTPLSQRKVLWLLHGLSDDGSTWLRHTRIEQFAEKYGLVVVMPSAGRSMYCDNVLGQDYFSHIADELPEYLELVFGLSRKREDNYIAGLSMGGMGAMKLALSFPERYSAVASLSGLLDLKPMLPFINDDMKNEFPFLFNEMDSIDTTPLNPVNLLSAERHAGLPMYIACGLQDDLLYCNYSFKAKTDELGLDVKYVFEDGVHEWAFWNVHIEKFLSFCFDKEE